MQISVPLVFHCAGPQKTRLRRSKFAFRLRETVARIFPQQRKLMGSSAQISSGVCRCGSQKQVPEAGSGRFRCVLVWLPETGSGSGGRFRKVPEGSGRFRKVPVCAGVGSGGRFRKVPVCAGGVGFGGKFRKVPEGSGVCWCRFRRQVPEGSGGFRCVLVQVPEPGSGRLWGVPVCVLA